MSFFLFLLLLTVVLIRQLLAILFIGSVGIGTYNIILLYQYDAELKNIHIEVCIISIFPEEN